PASFRRGMRNKRPARGFLAFLIRRRSETMMEPTLPLEVPVLDPRPRAVFTHGGEGAGHDGATHRVVAERIAVLLGMPFGGPCESRTGGAPSYLVPRAPICGPLAALRYGIEGEH